MSQLDLSNAKTLFAEGQKSKEAYLNLIGGRLWKLVERQDDETGEWVYTIHLDRLRLARAKSVLADCANKLNSTLDHIVSAMARAQGSARDRSIYFPLNHEHETNFIVKLEELAPKIGQCMVDVIAANHSKYGHEAVHLFAIKEIANATKHWDLLPTEAKAVAVAINNPNGTQTIPHIPSDTFKNSDNYEYCRSTDKLPNESHSIVVSVEISGLKEGIHKWPDSALRCSCRYIEGLIDSVVSVRSDRLMMLLSTAVDHRRG